MKFLLLFLLQIEEHALSSKYLKTKLSIYFQFKTAFEEKSYLSTIVVIVVSFSLLSWEINMLYNS